MRDGSPALMLLQYERLYTGNCLSQYAVIRMLTIVSKFRVNKSAKVTQQQTNKLAECKKTSIVALFLWSIEMSKFSRGCRSLHRAL